ncbi:hypothetical protein CTAM01_07650 [Colletotrichum tamarilloi]|uniref:Uncharacterized protein n=1 Tax=Colletotrichum tamarilloi TaxID=1209934 RepID=A0ABQ9R905_9PEZI|nr:uncharacterized protein CTAM01_07650 [Colletotrichum tamarilloi]KAK1498013.1 hypothetical protein CTAM01_07650 [Colletotrichum tamarilloi]
MRRNYTLHSSRRRVNSIIDDNISLHAPVRSTNLARAESTRWLSLEPSQDLKGSRSSGTGRWNATASASLVCLSFLCYISAPIGWHGYSTQSAPSVCYAHREDESLAARWKPSASANVQVAVNNMAPSSVRRSLMAPRCQQVPHQRIRRTAAVYCSRWLPKAPVFAEKHNVGAPPHQSVR